jgi:hypothetical protein
VADAEPSGAFNVFLDSLKEREQRDARAHPRASTRYTPEQIEDLDVLSQHAALARDNLLLLRVTWDRAERQKQDPGTILNYTQDAEAALRFRRALAEQLRMLLRGLESWLETDEEDGDLASIHKRLRPLYGQIRREAEPNAETLDKLEQLLSDTSDICEERTLGPG